MQKPYLQNDIIDTVYFGGGTPSLLSPSEIEEILHSISKHYSLNNEAEITLEGNPDDLTIEYLKGIKDVGINRLSIGVQSFFDQDLQWMNRRHNSKQSINSIWNSLNCGFDNISIDLIYGLPELTLQRWDDNIQRISQFSIQHLSAYHLTIEPNTVLYRFKARGEIVEIDEDLSNKQFHMLLKSARDQGFEQYEISNFAKDGLYSKHNTNYWKQEKYLGLGPSAHSFNHHSRQWNINNVFKYIKDLNENIVPYTIEELTLQDKYNDYILTGIRTKWGINSVYINKHFNGEYYNHFENAVNKYIKTNILSKDETNNITLTDNGKFISDKIAQEFMIVV